MAQTESISRRTAVLIAAATATVTLAGVFTLAGLFGFTRPTPAPPAPSSSLPVGPESVGEEELVIVQQDEDDEEQEHHEKKHHGKKHHESREHDHDD